MRIALKIFLLLVFPVLVHGQILTNPQLTAELNNLVPDNTQKLITPAYMRRVIQDGWNARISVYGNSNILGKLTYGSLFPITNDGDLIYKAYLETRLAAVTRDSTDTSSTVHVNHFNGRIGDVFLDSLDLVGLAYPRYSNPDGFLKTINPATVRAMFSNGTGLAFNPSSGQFSLSATTSNVPEGSNLYFTSSRVKALIFGDSPIIFNSTTGHISFAGISTIGIPGQQMRVNSSGTGFEYFTPTVVSQTVILQGPVTGSGNTGTPFTTSITDNSITTSKINNGAVTPAKLNATGTPTSSTWFNGANTWRQIVFSDIASTPNSLAGYGIADAYPLTGNPSLFINISQSRNGFSASGSLYNYNPSTGLLTQNYTPENISNKNQSAYISNSTTKYTSDFSVRHKTDSIDAAITAGLATKQNTLTFTPENQANKNTSNYISSSTTKYLSDYTARRKMDSIDVAINAITSRPQTPLSAALPIRIGSGSGSCNLVDNSGNILTDISGNPLTVPCTGGVIQIDTANSSRPGSFSASDYYLLHHLSSLYYPLTGNPAGYLTSSSLIPISQGGTGSNTAAGARINLGVAIGSNVEAWSVELDGIRSISGFGVVRRTSAGTYTASPLIAADIPPLPYISSSFSESDPRYQLFRDSIRAQGLFFASPVSGTGKLLPRAITLTDIPEIPFSKTSGFGAGALWNTYADIPGNPTLSTVAGTGNYSDLIGAPTIVSPPFSDASALIKSSTDATKLLKFSNANIPSGTTRTLSPQNADYTIAGTDISNTFTQQQTFNLGVFMNSSIQMTPFGALTCNNNIWIPLADNTTKEMRFVSEGLINLYADLAFPAAVVINSKGMTIPRRPTSSQSGLTTNGTIAYNSTTNRFEFRENGQWVNYSTGTGGGGTLSSVDLSGAEFSFTNHPLISNGTIGIALNTNGVAYGKIQQVTGNKFLGNPTGSLANASEIGIDNTLVFSGSNFGVNTSTLANSFVPTSGTITGHPVSGNIKFSSGVQMASISGNSLQMDDGTGKINFTTLNGIYANAGLNGSSVPQSTISMNVPGYNPDNIEVASGSVTFLTSATGGVNIGYYLGGNYVKLLADPSTAQYTIKFPSAAPTTNSVLKFTGTNYIWDASSSGSTYTPGSFNNTAVSQGFDITGSVISMHATNGILPGMVNAVAQSFGGPKTFLSDVIINKHIVGNSGVPTISGSSGFMTTGPTITGTDVGGTITFTTKSTSTSSGLILTVTFNTAYSNPPTVILVPANFWAVQLDPHYQQGVFVPAAGESAGVTTTTFSLYVANGTLPTATTFKFNYLVIQ